jgi:hypothetical protein
VADTKSRDGNAMMLCPFCGGELTAAEAVAGAASAPTAAAAAMARARFDPSSA